MYKVPAPSQTVCSICRAKIKKDEAIVFTQNVDGHRFHKPCLQLMAQLIYKPLRPGEITRVVEVEEHRARLAAAQAKVMIPVEGGDNGTAETKGKTKGRRKGPV